MGACRGIHCKAPAHGANQAHLRRQRPRLQIHRLAALRQDSTFGIQQAEVTTQPRAIALLRQVVGRFRRRLRLALFGPLARQGL